MKGIWVQHRVSPEPFNLLLSNFHRMLQKCITSFELIIKQNSHVTFGGHFGSHIGANFEYQSLPETVGSLGHMTVHELSFKKLFSQHIVCI